MSLEDPIVPQEYTHYASFTSLFILHMGIVCFENEEYAYRSYCNVVVFNYSMSLVLCEKNWIYFGSR